MVLNGAAPQERNPPINEKSILLWKVKTVSAKKMTQVRPHASSTAGAVTRLD